MIPRTSRHARQLAQMHRERRCPPIARVLRGAKRSDFAPDSLIENLKRLFWRLWRL